MDSLNYIDKLICGENLIFALTSDEAMPVIMISPGTDQNDLTYPDALNLLLKNHMQDFMMLWNAAWDEQYGQLAVVGHSGLVIFSANGQNVSKEFEDKNVGFSPLTDSKPAKPVVEFHQSGENLVLSLPESAILVIYQRESTTGRWF